MAERLTERKEIKGITYTIQPHIENNLVIHKLGLLEDILEKYGIESVEELENIIINGLAMLDIQKINILKEIELKTDRDTWQKACELACEREDDCYVYDNIHRAYEFYQQAKKEGNDE